MATTRSPLVVLGGLVVLALLPLLAMWIAVTDAATFAYFAAFGLYFLVAHVALPAWVYLDAVGRGSDSAVGWTALSFFLPFVGFAAYYVLGRPDAPYEAGAGPRARRE